jgi:hypothetical protein
VRLEGLLADGGLGMPPMPDMAQTRLKEREEWYFSTRTFKEPPTNLLHYVRKAIGGVSPDYVLVASAGEKPEDVALHYYLVRGILQLFVQIGWAGAEAVPGRTNDLARECLALAGELITAVPGALHRGLLDPGGRLTVVATDRGDSFWETASGEGRLLRTSRPSRRNVRNLPGPREVLTECVGWCRGKAGSGEPSAER